MNEAEIKVKYKALHDTLSDSYYGGASDLTKEQFDLQHGKIWADMKVELIDSGFLEPTIPARDLAKEIDTLKQQFIAHGLLK